jgi:hypothetical protein
VSRRGEEAVLQDESNIWACNKPQRQVEEGRRSAREQKGLIARLKASGADTRNAERTLCVLESNLAMFEEYRTWLKR